MTANNVRAANASKYEPRTLPAIFSRTAGTQGSFPGLGALPDNPYTQEDRPSRLTMRLPPAYTPQTYRMGVGDVLVLSTPSNANTIEALSGLLAAQNSRQGYTIQDDGAINIPDVGRVTVGGLTLAEAEAEVFSALVDSAFEPSFSLEIADFNSQRVALGGAIKSPKVVSITLTPLLLSEALNQAGGITVADLDYASIRLYRDGQLYQIPLDTYLKTPSIQQIVLKDGDSVYVDTEYDLDKARGFFDQQIRLQTTRLSARSSALSQLSTEINIRRGELNEQRANFQTRANLDALERDYVYIAGEVGSQSRFTLPFERTASLADALFSEGDGVPNATGNIGEVYVIRGTGDGKNVQAWHLNAYNAANLILATQFELRPNDVIFVSEKPLTALSRVMRQVSTSVALLLP